LYIVQIITTTLVGNLLVRPFLGCSRSAGQDDLKVASGLATSLVLVGYSLGGNRVCERKPTRCLLRASTKMRTSDDLLMTSAALGALWSVHGGVSHWECGCWGGRGATASQTWSKAWGFSAGGLANRGRRAGTHRCVVLTRGPHKRRQRSSREDLGARGGPFLH